MSTTTKLKTLREALLAVPPGVRIDVRMAGNNETMNGEVEHVGDDHFILGSGTPDERYDIGWHLSIAHVVAFRREHDEHDEHDEQREQPDTDRPPA